MPDQRTTDLATPPAKDGVPKPPPKYNRVEPGSFEQEAHYYPRVINAQMHALVKFFLTLDNQRIVLRYCHLNPKVDPQVLAEILRYEPKYFRWSGSDLLYCTTETGVRRMIIIETNSCPSGQKSMPLYDEHDELGGYRANLERTFVPAITNKRLPEGELAVIYDKNYMESSGYAATLAELTQESVHLVEFPDGADQPRVRFTEGLMEIRKDDDTWVPIRSAFRYVTQKPWNRIPVHTKTQILNPVVACLAGGRNKAVAAKAYEFYNAELNPTGLKIRTPETFWDISKSEVPFWVQRLGGHAVVKVPYANAGQGVYTITSDAELRQFEESEQYYDRFIVQSLIGNYEWSSTGSAGRLYHVGTLPNKRGQSYVADLRLMVSAGHDGFRPLVMYARRAHMPLLSRLGEYSSWDMLGTNLSYKHTDGGWGTDASRLLLMDRRDFNTLGLGLDDLIEAYIQAVLSTIAIDRMATRLVSTKGTLRRKLFRDLNADAALLEEIVR